MSRQEKSLQRQEGIELCLRCLRLIAGLRWCPFVLGLGGLFENGFDF